MASPSDAAEAALLRLAAALGAPGGTGVDSALERAAHVAPAVAVEELLLQAHLFCGYPRVLDAFARWRRLCPEPPAGPEADAADWPARGEHVCARVYGPYYAKLRENVRALHPDLDRWMVTDGYGKVLGRPGLSLVERELANVALLAAQGAEPQLHSHLRGALRVGAAPGRVTSALAAARAEAPAHADAADRIWARVCSASALPPPGVGVDQGGGTSCS
ncbi:MAG: carboxymuconolactone decarboxylase family protein [Gemmatimonadota bacterium]